MRAGPFFDDRRVLRIVEPPATRDLHWLAHRMPNPKTFDRTGVMKR